MGTSVIHVNSSSSSSSRSSSSSNVAQHLASSGVLAPIAQLPLGTRAPLGLPRAVYEAPTAKMTVRLKIHTCKGCLT